MTGLSRQVPSTPLLLQTHVVCDLLDASKTTQVIRSLQPDIVAHTQALSDVDRCEQEPLLARAMNAQAISHVVEALKGSEAILIYVSSDYVFDGSKGSAYDEEDAPNPINTYGRSKCTGEEVALSYPNAFVIRTSTLFGEGRMNFCDQAASCLMKGESVEAFRDQTTSPTYTKDLAEGIRDVLLFLKNAVPGLVPSRVLHIANQGGCTRLEFAYRIADLLGKPRSLIRAIAVADQKRQALRPAYSALTSRYLAHCIGRRLRPWEEALEDYLHQRHWLN